MCRLLCCYPKAFGNLIAMVYLYGTRRCLRAVNETNAYAKANRYLLR